MLPLLGNLGRRVVEDLQSPVAAQPCPLLPGVAGELRVRVTWLVSEALFSPRSFSKQKPETFYGYPDAIGLRESARWNKAANNQL